MTEKWECFNKTCRKQFKPFKVKVGDNVFMSLLCRECLRKKEQEVKP